MVQSDGIILDRAIFHWMSTHGHCWICCNLVLLTVGVLFILSYTFMRHWHELKYVIIRCIEFCSSKYRNKDDIQSPIAISFKNMMKFHLGTVALGSFLISFIQMLRTVLCGSDVSWNDFSISNISEQHANIFISCFVQLDRSVNQIVRNVKQQLVIVAWAVAKVTCNISIEMYTSKLVFGCAFFFLHSSKW